eukprot:scaffold5219_cov148-Skeletonema_dohrnii-CCMP3373.AAC.2
MESFPILPGRHPWSGGINDNLLEEEEEISTRYRYAMAMAMSDIVVIRLHLCKQGRRIFFQILQR